MICGWFPWDPAASKALTSCEMGSQAVQALLLLKHLDAMQAPGGGGTASVGEWLVNGRSEWLVNGWSRMAVVYVFLQFFWRAERLNVSG